MIVMKPDLVRAGWRSAGNARDELKDGRNRTDDAAGTDMADLASTLTDAATDMDGVLRVALAVISEHGTNVEACISDFIASDGASAGEFHGLAR